MRGKKIIIPTETLNKWKLKRYYGDITDILKKYPDDKCITRTAVSNAHNGGNTKPEVIEKMTEFYETL